MIGSTTPTTPKISSNMPQSARRRGQPADWLTTGTAAGTVADPPDWQFLQSAGARCSLLGRFLGSFPTALLHHRARGYFLGPPSVPRLLSRRFDLPILALLLCRDAFERHVSPSQFVFSARVTSSLRANLERKLWSTPRRLNRRHVSCARTLAGGSAQWCRLVTSLRWKSGR
jgi:hypothetical protein